jgi:hypothetical protein
MTKVHQWTRNGGIAIQRPQTRDRKGRYSFKSHIAYQYHRFMAWLWKWTKRAAFVALAVGFLFASYFFGKADAQSITAVNQITVASNKTAPVMERIAAAESQNHQYAPNGQVLIHVNKNGTVDLGEYQINSIWFALATKLGYDLTKESDNKAFAEYLCENYGTEPWQSSSANW